MLDLAEVLQLVQGFKDGELATELGRGSIGDPVHQPIHLWQEVVVSLPGDLVVQPQILQRQVSSSRAWRQGLRRRAADLAGADVGLVVIEEAREPRVASYHLVEGVDLLHIEGDEGADKGRDASLVDQLLLGAHVVEGGQVDHVADLESVDEGLHEPARRDAHAQLEGFGLRTLLGPLLAGGESEDLSLLARCIFLVDHSELGVAQVAEGVLALLAHVVVETLAHLRRVVDLVLEDLEHVRVDLGDRVPQVLQVAIARSPLDRLVEVGGRLEDRDHPGKLHLDELAVLPEQAVTQEHDWVHLVDGCGKVGQLQIDFH